MIARPILTLQSVLIPPDLSVYVLLELLVLSLNLLQVFLEFALFDPLTEAHSFMEGPPLLSFVLPQLLLHLLLVILESEGFLYRLY